MPVNTWPIIAQGDPYARLGEILPRPRPLIVDGGANKGRTVERFLSLRPQARIVAYEPIPELAAKLAKRFAQTPGVRVRQAALGAGPALLTLNILESRTCSSLLAPEGIRDKHPGKPLAVARQARVAVVRLDQELDQAPDAVKLDLQGYELEALRGAVGVLGGIGAVLTEVAFRPLYQGQPLAHEVRDWLTARGFALEGLYDPWRDDRGDLVSGDALFRRGP